MDGRDEYERATFLIVPGRPLIGYDVLTNSPRGLATLEPAVIPPPRLLSERDEIRDLVILVVSAFVLGFFVGIATENLWWLA